MNKQELVKALKLERDMLRRTSDYSERREGAMSAYDHAFNMARGLEEPEKVKVPHFVDKWLKKRKKDFKSSLAAMSYLMSYGWDDETHIEYKLYKWLPDNVGKFVSAWDGNYVVEEPEYYARIKGHELIDTDVELIPGDKTHRDWYRNIYFVLQSDGKLIIDMKDSGLSGATHSMTRAKWIILGVNASNAEFEEVENG